MIRSVKFSSMQVHVHLIENSSASACCDYRQRKKCSKCMYTYSLCIDFILYFRKFNVDLTPVVWFLAKNELML